MSTAPARPSRWKQRIAVVVGLLVAAPVVGLVIWSFVALSFSYSRGERAGYVQKLSRRGWVCKTWEGELAQVNMPGALSDMFLFTVRDDAVARRLNESLGQRVVLTYEQHKGVPSSCFGETEYFVVDVRTAPAP
jgi:hypothetical protein